MTAKVLFIGAGLLLTAGTAFADDPAPPAGGAGDAAGAGSGSAAAPAPGVDATAATPAAGAWLGPQIDRPYAMAKGKIGAYGGFDIDHYSLGSGMMGSLSLTRELLEIGGAYGVTDQISAGAQYGIPLATQGLPAGATDNSTGKGPLALFGMFQIVHDSKMSVAATADFTADLCGTVDMMGNCSVTKSIHAGLGFKYKVGPTMALFTGAPFGPGPVGQHLAISLETNGPITFGLPVGFAMQATPQIFGWVQTELFSVYLSNAPTGVDSFRVIGSDTQKGGIGIPLQLGALYGVNNQLDAGLALTFADLAHAGDFYAISLLGRWHN